MYFAWCSAVHAGRVRRVVPVDSIFFCSLFVGFQHSTDKNVDLEMIVMVQRDTNLVCRRRQQVHNEMKFGLFGPLTVVRFENACTRLSYACLFISQ